MERKDTMKHVLIRLLLVVVGLGLCTCAVAQKPDTQGRGDLQPIVVERPMPPAKPMPEWGGGFGSETSRGWGVSCKETGDCSVTCDKSGCSVEAEEDYVIFWDDQNTNKAAQCSVGCPKATCSISCEPPFIGCTAKCKESGAAVCECISAEE